MSSRVVTPEAVLLELPTAGTAVRALALSIDLIVNALAIWLVSTIVSLGVVLLGSGSGGLFSPVVIGSISVFAFLVAVPIGTEILWRGRSVGKLALGLKVVGTDGSRETPRQAMVRGFVSLIEIYFSLGVLAVVSSTLSPGSQRLGDLAAGTVVIKRPAGSGTSIPIAFHPPLGFESYVHTLNVAPMTDVDFVLVRDFLLRVNDLRAPKRWDLAVELAEVMRARIDATMAGPEHVLGTVWIPPGIHPEVWLVCVAAAYQLRSGGLLADAAAGLAPLAPVLRPPVGIFGSGRPSLSP